MFQAPFWGATIQPTADTKGVILESTTLTTLGVNGTLPSVPREPLFLPHVLALLKNPAMNLCARHLEPSGRSLSRVHSTGVELLGGRKCAC